MQNFVFLVVFISFSVDFGVFRTLILFSGRAKKAPVSYAGLGDSDEESDF